MRMYNYLPIRIADYDFTLEVWPERILPEVGEKKQVVHDFDDGQETIVTLSGQSRFYVIVQWEMISAELADLIFDLWHDENKANGIERSFKWWHPIEEQIYIVRFAEGMERVITGDHVGTKEVSPIRLRVIGRPV